MTNVKLISPKDGDVVMLDLKDEGQDFTRWYVKNGIVIDCLPFQGVIWVGTKIIGPITVGLQLEIETRSGKQLVLNYPVVSAKFLSVEEAESVERYYKAWLERQPSD